jgi:hypothetical protein
MAFAPAGMTLVRTARIVFLCIASGAIPVLISVVSG